MNSALKRYTTVDFDSFRDLLNHIPEIEEEQLPTFLEIAGYPNYENVISNLYQFFLEEEKHGLGRIFLEALVNLLPDEDLSLQEYAVEREVFTNGGGRIDLVIKESSSNSNEQKVILIENKIYHTLNNDLEDYLDTFSLSNKIGIVLALEKQEVPEPFHCITHLDWLKEVEKLIGGAFYKAHPKYLALLQDFIQHIRTFYREPYSMEAYEFIYNEGNKIDRLLTFQDEVFNHLISEVQKVIPDTDWQWSRTSGWSGSLSRQNSQIILYFHFEDVFSQKRLTLTLYFRGEKATSVFNETNYTKKVEAFEEVRGFQLMDESRHRKWAKVAQKDYFIEGPEELKDFSKKVEKILKGEWEELVKELIKNFSL